MSDSDADEYVYYGTPLEQEQTCTHYVSRQAPKQAGQVVALPVHQQEVRDAQGRQRLHGAFTGGYSAGFFNTVGSQEGFKPSTFTSSRNNRAGQREQDVSDFLDEDELEDLQKKGLQTRSEYDTFASAPGAAAQAEAEQHASSRHGHEALNLFPQEALRPVVNSIGIQLLQKMGWRQGRGLGFHETQALSQMGYDVSAVEPGTDAATQRLKRRKWGPLVGLQAQNAAVLRPKPKSDVYGLGYDPYANAAEFRTARKRVRDEPAARPLRDRQGVRKRGVAFAASVVEDSDVYGGDLADYVDEDDERAQLHFEVVSSDDDDDHRGAARGSSPQRLQAAAVTQMIKARQGTMGIDSFIEGFERGAMADPQTVPGTKVPQRGIMRTHHRFERPCGRWYGAPLRAGTAPEAPVGAAPVVPPEDPDVKKRIDIMAATVARGGDEMLSLVRKTHQGEDDYAFLHGGDGAAYFRGRVVQIRTALVRAKASILQHTTAALHGLAPDRAQQSTAQQQRPLTVEQRARLLQEPQLPGSQAPAAHRRDAATPRGGEKAPGAAGPTVVGRTGGGAPSREEVLARAESAGLLRRGGALASRFVKAGALPPEAGGWTSAAAEAAKKPPEAPGEAAELPPVRTVHEWKPDPVLCKRFNVPDPFKGKRDAPQAAPGRVGEQLLSVPSQERGNVYAAALPDFMRPVDGAAVGDRQQQGGWEEELPPPPPLRTAAAAVSARPAAAGRTEAGRGGEGDRFDQAADELLASVDADFAKRVEEAAPAPDEVPLDKPIDVFKAIFEDSESDDDEGQEEEDEPAAAAAGGQPPGAQRRAALDTGRLAMESAAAAGDLEEDDRDKAAPAELEAPSAAHLQRNAAEVLEQAQAQHAEQARRSAAAFVVPTAEGAADQDSASDSEDSLRNQREKRLASGHRSKSKSNSNSKRRRDKYASDDEGRHRSKRHKGERKGKHKKSHGKERQREQDPVTRAVDVLKRDAMEQNLNTEEIIAMARELKKRSREKSGDREKSKSKHKHHKHSSNKDRRHRSQSPCV